ncbi:MAG: hypothetical protein ACOWWR_06360 [Eubacteriales bacterium]
MNNNFLELKLRKSLYSTTSIFSALSSLQDYLYGYIEEENDYFSIRYCKKINDTEHCTSLLLSSINEESLREKIDKECKNLIEIIYAQAISPISDPENYINDK